jgi:hypothetical protein
VALVLSFGIANAQQLPAMPPGALTGGQIQAALVGKTLSWINEFQKPVSMKLDSDGTANGSAVTGASSLKQEHTAGLHPAGLSPLLNRAPSAPALNPADDISAGPPR